ncbi:flippase [bacterium]|nr:flippase [candidate division CSSED10-310 bacterium]
MPSRSSLERLARNSAFIFAARGFETLGAILTVALLTRYLGVELFGDYAWIMALVLFFQPIVNFELNTILTREIARSPEMTSELLGNALALKWILIGLFIAAMALLVALVHLPGPYITAVVLAVMAEILLQHSMLFSGIFTAYERMEFELILTFMGRLLALAAILACVLFDFGFAAIFAGMLCAALLRFVAGYRIITTRFCAVHPFLTRKLITYLFSEAFLLTIGSFLTSLSFRVDIYILKWLRSAIDISLFYLPHTFVLQLQIIPMALVTALFPMLSRWGATDRDNLRRAWISATRLLTLTGGLIAVITTGAAPLIVKLLGGKDFLAATTSLRILIWCAVILFLNLLWTHLIIVLHQQRWLIVGAAVSLAVNGGLDIVLVPAYGHIGASLATVVGYFSQICIVFYFIARELRMDRQILRAVLIPLGITAIATMVIYATASISISLVGSTLLGVFVFIASIPLARALSREEVALLKRVVVNLRQRLTGVNHP